MKERTATACGDGQTMKIGMSKPEDYRLTLEDMIIFELFSK